MKMILVKDCVSCPMYGKCDAWQSLTEKQVFDLTISNATPTSFILKECQLDDSEEVK